jgi:hypothetical protein
MPIAAMDRLTPAERQVLLLLKLLLLGRPEATQGDAA